MDSDDHKPAASKPIEIASAASRRTLVGKLRDDIVSAQAPLLALAAYAGILLVPEQSAEALRTLFEYPAWLLLLALFAWLALLAYFASALICSTAWAFEKHDELVGIETKISFKTSSIRAAIIWIIALAPVAITVAFIWIAFASHPSRAIGPLFFAAFYTLFGILWSYGWVNQSEKTGYKEFLGMTVTHALVSLAIIGLVLIGVTRLIFSQDLPVVLMIVVWITVMLAVLHLFEWLSLRSGWPVLTTIVLFTILFSIFDWNDNHTVRTLESGPRSTEDIGSTFGNWITAHKDEIDVYTKAKRRYPVFIFVAEGGGLRAASITAQVMELLRKSCPDAIRHTFLSIGVSGGSVGAVLANAAMKRNALGTGCEGKIDQVVDTEATSALREDLLKSLIRGMLFADLPAQILPTSLASTWSAAASDRAQYLEDGLSSAWRRSTKTPDGASADLDLVSFGSLWDGPTGYVPALMLLATDVNSGRRVAASHVLMPPLPPTGTPCEKLFDPSATGDPAERTRVIALSEFMDKDLRATTAALVSARFPGITPAASVHCSDTKRRLVDGGYFENSGLTTAVDVVRLILPQVAASKLDLYVVTVENSEASAPELAESYFSELLSPFRAMEGTRSAHAELARASFTELLTKEQTMCGQKPCWLRFRLHRCDTLLPLGWSLSAAAISDIRHQLVSDTSKCSTSDTFKQMFALVR